MSIIQDCLYSCQNLIRGGQYGDSVKILKQILCVDPNNTMAWQMLKDIQIMMPDDDEVLNFYHKALEIEPNCSITLNNLALRLGEMNQYKEALPYAEKAIEIKPNDPVYLNNLGIVYKKLEMLDKAEECFEKTLIYEPDDAYVLVNLGTVYAHQFKFDKAIEAFKKALDIEPGISGAHVNMAFAYHHLGKHKEGWQEYEHRLRHFPQLVAYMSKLGPEKEWGGTSSIDGKKLVVYCEQGYGDGIQMARYFKDLKDMDCHLIVICGAALKDLFSTLNIADEIITKEDFLENGIDDFDYHVPCMSLPLRLNKLEPSGSSYIHFPKKDHKGFKVGLCWQGNKMHPHDHLRSCGTDRFMQITRVPNVEYYSLQVESCNKGVVESNLKSFLDTANLLRELDLVITVDTSVLHLAGAMGIKTWGIITHIPDFRWDMESEDRWYKTPWYSNVELIRHKQLDDWDSILEIIRRRLCITAQNN